MSEHRPCRARIIVASTRAAVGLAADRTGPALRDWLRGRGAETPEPVVVPDGPEVGRAIDRALAEGVDLLVTTGGTGIAAGDVTPEQTAPFLDRELPGIAEEIRRRGTSATPLAVLSRGLAGMAGRTLVVNLPGSMGAVRDGIAVLEELVDHVLAQRDGAGHEGSDKERAADTRPGPEPSAPASPATDAHPHPEHRPLSPRPPGAAR